jgi:predicted ATP-dependent endonuclease of OLD family
MGKLACFGLNHSRTPLLSFIAYNAFYSNAVVVIDEPELSLHVDWQRQLFPILLGQQATNQFVIATHSPFIYSKYPDKELQIDATRGDEEN